jgi:hypothetical protein
MSHTVPRWMSRHRKALIIVAAAVALVSVPLASSAASRTEGSTISASAARPIAAAATHQLATSALDVAASGGDAKPESIEAVATTLAMAMAVASPSDKIPGSAHRNVYLVVMKGNFTLSNAPRPPQSKAPTGHYLVIAFDPKTLELVGLSLRDRAPSISLRSIGPVSNLIARE